MATYQERLYTKVNGPLADRFQSRAIRRAVAVAMFAFFTSALAPRLFLAWNLDDNLENSNG